MNITKEELLKLCELQNKQLEKARALIKNEIELEKLRMEYNKDMHSFYDYKDLLLEKFK